MARRRPVPRRIPHLRESPDTEYKLAIHGLSVEQALDVRAIDPVLVSQTRKPKRRLDGTYYVQPARLKLIGPDRSGRLLTIVIEYPDHDNLSTIVTGFDANARDQAHYDQRTGDARR